jgi:hypothetical protein
MASQRESYQGEASDSTAAYHAPGTEAPSHIDEHKQRRRDVKQLLTNHWDLDTLPREELEEALGLLADPNDKPSNREV